MDFIRRDQIGWSDYRIEFNGKWLDWNKTWEACESKGYILEILRDAEYDLLGNIVKPPRTKKHYGKVFIVRYYD